MKVGHNWSGNDSIFFPWPKTVEHVIDEDSPMYEMCKQALAPPSSQPQGKHFGAGRKPRSDLNTVTTTTTHSTLLSGNALSSDSNKSIKSEDYEIVVILEGKLSNCMNSNRNSIQLLHFYYKTRKH